MVSILGDDVEHSVKQCKRCDDDFWRRQSVRSFCAYAEGLAWLLKQMVVKIEIDKDAATRQVVSVTSDDESTVELLRIVRDEYYTLNEAGDFERQQPHRRTLQDIKFAYRCFAASYGLQGSLDTQSLGWSQLRTIFKVRNQITHPRNRDALHVTDEQMKCLSESIDFLTSSWLRLLKDASSKLLNDLVVRK